VLNSEQNLHPLFSPISPVHSYSRPISCTKGSLIDSIDHMIRSNTNKSKDPRQLYRKVEKSWNKWKNEWHFYSEWRTSGIFCTFSGWITTTEASAETDESDGMYFTTTESSSDTTTEFTEDVSASYKQRATEN
jgi:hypothetical protein